MKLVNFALALCTVTLVGLIGCATSLTPQTKTQIAQIQNKSALDQAKAKAAAELDQLNGKNKPLTHPIAAANETVEEIKPYLIALLLFSFTAWAVLFGLSFTAFSFASFLGPVFRWVWILSASALAALPFLPLGALIILGALVGLFIYELVKNKGNVVEAFDDTEAQLGFGVAGATPSTAAVTQTTATKTTASVSTGTVATVVADIEAEVKKLV
jgi:hypothetical protein